MEQKLCLFCHFPLADNFYFCPNCGKKIKPTLLSTSIEKQLIVYILSVLLPPFGLIPAFKYLKQKDEKSKIIGMIVIFLTILSTVISIWLTIEFVNQVNTAVDKQMKQYKDLGF